MIEFNGEKYKVFDAHTHWSRLMTKILRPVLETLSTNEILDFVYKKWKFLKENSSNPTEKKINAYLLLLDHYGIDRAINLPVFQLDVNFSLQCQKLSNERIIGFGAVKPLKKPKNVEKKLKHLKKNSYKGIKLHAEYNPFNVKLHFEELSRVLEFMESEKMIALFHSGSHFFIKNLSPLLKKFDNLSVILGHMGLNSQVDQAIKCAINHPQVFLETSGQGYQYMIEKALNHKDIGVERILYGSDLPTLDPQVEMMKILALPISKSEKECIFWNNCEKMLQ